MVKVCCMVNDHGAKQMAVKINGPTVAKCLGYEHPSETKISRLEIVNPTTGKILLEVDIGKGKYLSAIWVEYYLSEIGKPRSEYLDIEYMARASLKAYMGLQVVTDAINPKLKNHLFVRALLSTTERLKLKIIWQKN